MNFSKDHVDIAEAMSQIVMAWLAFIGAGLVTAFFLCFFVWCVVNQKGLAANSFGGVINCFLIQLLRIIFKHLFPDRSKLLAKQTEE
jgi:hypothetical protein